MNDRERAEHPGLRPIDDSALTRESWKIFQIMAEFVEGFERLAHIKPSVSIFGSARFPSRSARAAAVCRSRETLREGCTVSRRWWTRT